MTQAAKLSVSHVQAGYGDVQVLWDISLEVAAGELVCLIGSNGAGKTTFLRCVSGILPVTAGSILVDGHDMTNASPSAFVKAGIAHVPEGRRLFSAMSVRDNLLMGAYLRDDREGVAADLDRVYTMFPILADRRRQDAGTMSGGEQQMLAIGRALMTNPKLLILDEATEGLAPMLRLDIWKCLARLKDEGQAILIVDKHLSALVKLADRHTIIEKGSVVWSGTSAALDQKIVQRYLQV